MERCSLSEMALDSTHMHRSGKEKWGIYNNQQGARGRLNETEMERGGKEEERGKAGGGWGYIVL